MPPGRQCANAVDSARRTESSLATAWGDRLDAVLCLPRLERGGEELCDQGEIVGCRRGVLEDVADPLQRAISVVVEPAACVQQGVRLEWLSALLSPSSTSATVVG